MKVLFVSSGNSGDVGVLVKNQGVSLIKEGLEIDFFLIKGKGVWGYLKNTFKIWQVFKKGSYNLVHAHYSLSAFTAALAKRGPLVVSLMGSDAYLNRWMRILAKLFYKISWQKTIVKTHQMKDILKMCDAIVLPNGIDLDRFCILDTNIARDKIGFDKDKKLIVFIADPLRDEKNYALAKIAVSKLERRDVELMPVFNIQNEMIPFYLNAANLLILTSKWEGSVNVVKEAMACNLPIVSTDVGDVRLNTQGVEGCFITTENPDEIADCINKALEFGRRTNGREKLISMELDSKSVAKKIIKIYEEIVHVK